MPVITLDGNEMISVEIAYRLIQKKLGLPDYFGANLDALWDALSTTGKPTSIELTHAAELRSNLGKCGDLMLEVFQEAGRVNPLLQVDIS